MPREAFYETINSEIIICNNCGGRGTIIPWRSELEERSICPTCEGKGRVHKTTKTTYEPLGEM